MPNKHDNTLVKKFHFVTTIPLTRTGVLYPRVQDFCFNCLDLYLLKFLQMIQIRQYGIKTTQTWLENTY